jgi:hypothetical protein
MTLWYLNALVLTSLGIVGILWIDKLVDLWEWIYDDEPTVESSWDDVIDGLLVCSTAESPYDHEMEV